MHVHLREPTTFDVVAPGNVVSLAENSKNKNSDAREIYTQKPYYDSRLRSEYNYIQEQTKSAGGLHTRGEV